MKASILTLTAAIILLTACAQSSNRTAPNESTVGIANPASVFCTQQGGRSEIRTTVDGNEYGVCLLPTGEIMEEWEYFRLHHSAS